MTLADLIAQFRTDSQDNTGAYLSSDDTVTLWLNEAEEEAALRANLIYDATTAEVCSIAAAAGVSSYPLHSSVFSVARATFLATGSTDPIVLKLTDRLEQDRTQSGWRTLTDTPGALIVDDTRITLGCLPSTDGTISLEVYRAPLNSMESDGDEPEIGRAHHRFLPLWALHRHFMQPDAEIHDPGRSEKALEAFTRQFGQRPDAAMRRNHWTNAPASNKAWW